MTSSSGKLRLSSRCSGSFWFQHQLGIWQGALYIATPPPARVGEGLCSPAWPPGVTGTPPQLGSVHTAGQENLSRDACLFSFSSSFGLWAAPSILFSFSPVGLIGNLTEIIAGPGLCRLWGLLPGDRTTLRCVPGSELRVCRGGRAPGGDEGGVRSLRAPGTHLLLPLMQTMGIPAHSSL